MLKGEGKTQGGNFLANLTENKFRADKGKAKQAVDVESRGLKDAPAEIGTQNEKGERQLQKKSPGDGLDADGFEVGGKQVRQPEHLWPVPVEELLRREIKPREMLLDPILPGQGLAMLYAYRGIGKTFLALGKVAAIASGARFLRWSAARRRRVLYVGGELPAATLREGLAMILAGIEESEPPRDALRIVTPDLQDRPMPDLAAEGQRFIEPHLERVSFTSAGQSSWK